MPLYSCTRLRTRTSSKGRRRRPRTAPGRSTEGTRAPGGVGAGGHIGNLGRASGPRRSLPIDWGLSGPALHPKRAAQPRAWRASPRRPGERPAASPGRRFDHARRTMSTGVVSGARPSPAYLGRRRAARKRRTCTCMGHLHARMACARHVQRSHTHTRMEGARRGGGEAHRVLAVAHDPLWRVRAVLAHAQLLLVGFHLPHAHAHAGAHAWLGTARARCDMRGVRPHAWQARVWAAACRLLMSMPM